MRLPRLWRKKRNGKSVGSWYATYGGRDVSMGTSDAEVARRKLRELVGGRGDPADDIEQAADLDNAGSEGGPGAPADPPKTSGFLGGEPPAGRPQLEAAPPGGGEAGAPDEADGMAAAAAEVGGGSGGDDAGAGGAAAVDPEVLDGMLRVGALVMVDAQLRLQAALIKRYTGNVAGEVPADAPMRAAAAEAWVAQLKIWVPADRMLPPWALALVLPLMAVPVQLAGAHKPAPDGDIPDAQVVR